MLLNGTAVIENIDEGDLTRELELAKFRNYGREKFADMIKSEISFYEFFEHSSKFYSITLPNEISDYFLRKDFAHFFWLSEAPVIKAVEKFLKLKSEENNFIANQREVKEFYFKWIMQKNKKQKHFFAQSIVNIVERNFIQQNFYSMIIYGIILSKEKSLYNPEKAIEIYNRAEEIVNNCLASDDLKFLLLYYINLFKGFTYLNEYEFQNAKETFKIALSYNSYGTTASFYCALSFRYLDDFDNAYDKLKEILLADKLRFQFAINYNNLPLFNYFFESATFYNVFTEMGFAQMLPDIDFLIRSLYSGDPNSMQITYTKLINLDNLRNKDFFDESVYKEIEFMKSALEQYRHKKNGLIRILEDIFRNKLIITIEYIRNLIESHYFDLIKEEMNVFDKQIAQNKRQLELIKHEKEDAIKKITQTQKETEENLEEVITQKSTFFESKIENIDKNAKFNPTSTLFSSMLFTVVVSFLIFLIVGFTALFSGSGEMSGTKLFVVQGVKWGGTTFVIGIFISIFTSISASWEKNEEKKKLVNKLKYVKETEAQERSLLKEDSERKIIAYKKKFDEKIKSQEKIIENFEQERENNYKHKFSLSKKEMDVYLNPLNDLLESLQKDG